MSFTLYSFDGDYRAFKAEIAAAYNGIALTRKTVDVAAGEHQSPAFAAKSPLGKVPVLETESGTIFESNAIARYIARLRRDTELYGSTFFESGLIDGWLDFVTLELDLAVSSWLFPVFGFKEYSADVYSTAVTGTAAALATLEKHLLSRTFLVGNSVTLADIAVASTLYYGYKFLFDGAFVARFPSVTRWFITCVNQPNFKSVLGAVSLAEKETLATGANLTSASVLGGASGSGTTTATATGGAGGKKGGEGGAKKGGDAGKKEAKQPKKTEEEPKPKPAPAPAPVPTTSTGGAGDDEDDEDKPKPKVKGPFDDLPPSKMNMDHWKRTYSNSRSDYYASMVPFWAEIFDKEGYSIWFAKYKYNEENTVDYKTSNLVGGFLQRCDEIRRFAFGSMVILNETAPFEVEGCWLLRGQSIAPLLEANPDAEYYEWTKVDTDDEKARAKVADYWCSMGNINGKAQYDSKIFK